MGAPRGDLSHILEDGTLNLRDTEGRVKCSDSAVTCPIYNTGEYCNIAIVRKRNLLLLNAHSVKATK